MRQIAVRGDHITLGQLLKVAGFVGSGGEVKTYLQETSIRINNEHDKRRGRKLRAGDTVQIEQMDPIELIAFDPTAAEE